VKNTNTEQIAKSVEQDREIPKSFKNWLLKTFEDIDKIDVFSEYDRKMTIDENKEIFLEKFGIMCSESYRKNQEVETAKAQLKDLKRITEEHKEVREQEIEKEERELIAEWKNQKIEEIEIKEFETAQHLITLTTKGFTYATIITGEGGIGKTFKTIQTIKKITLDFIYKSGYTTPLSLYMFLYNNKDKLIVLDDIEGIFKDGVALAILKGCLWDTDGKRLVFYDTTSGKLDAPNCFEFTGRLIILCNKIPNLNDLHTKAVLSRTIYYEVNFTYNQKIKIITQILNSKKDLTAEVKKKILKIITENTNVATENLNIRTLEKLVAYIKYDTKIAESLFKQTTQKDTTKEIVWELMNKGLSAKEQISEFITLTGKGRTLFFEIKKELKNQMKKVEYVEIRN
jgi:hypothetical protein